jgi:hypothetical protein
MKARKRRAGPLSPSGRLSLQAVEPDGVWAATLAVVEFPKVSHRVIVLVTDTLRSSAEMSIPRRFFRWRVVGRQHAS